MIFDILDGIENEPSFNLMVIIHELIKNYAPCLIKK
jgi:hypothetical protein